LIEKNITLFQGFNIAYSTNNLESNFSGLSLASIEQECTSLKKFFYGSGLLFYSDIIYQQMKSGQKVEIPLDFSLSLDSNVAERFRVWEGGGCLSGTDKQKMEKLIPFIKDSSFNFDYSFFILENLLDSMDPNNYRPFDTIRALKRFDYLHYNKENFSIDQPEFVENREKAGKRTIDTLYAFHNNNESQKTLDRRKIMYLMLLQALIFKPQEELTLEEKISSLVNFSLDTLGGFAKEELYFAWKFLKYGESLRFFDPVSQLSNKTINKVKGMSWDLFATRYQETLASMRRDNSKFFVPFFASFDNRFVELTDACPIKCVVIDHMDKRVTIIHLDEQEFQKDINHSISTEVQKKLSNPEEKLKRMNNRPSSGFLDKEIAKLESELKKYC